MATNVHITHWDDVIATVKTDADAGQAGIVDPGVDPSTSAAFWEWCWMTDDAAELHFNNRFVTIATDVTTYKDMTFGDVTANDDMYLGEYLYHAGDTDTYIRYQADQIIVMVGGAILLNLIEGATDYITVGAQLRTLYGIWDTDADTGIQVEESADEDLIRFDCGGTGNVLVAAASYVDIAKVLRLTLGSQDYYFNTSGQTLTLKGQSAGQISILAMYGASDPVDANVGYRVYAQGAPDQAVNYAFLYMIFQQSTSIYQIATANGGSGTSYPIVINTVGNANQVTLATGGNVGIKESAPETLLEMSSTAPYITLHNTTEENGVAGRESIIYFKGEKADSTEHTLGFIRCDHGDEPAADDYNGIMYLAVNDGNDVTPSIEVRIYGEVTVYGETAPYLYLATGMNMYLPGDMIQESGQYYYLGDPSSDGCWRFYNDGTDLVFQRRESSSWVEKGAFTAS